MKPLYTSKGSRIWHSKYGVGKKVGDKVYVHKDYALEVVPTDIWWDAQDMLHTALPNYKYNCICYNVKTQTVRFDEAPDFDTAKEPIVGRMITVTPINLKEPVTIKMSRSNAIWHHKWLWVAEDYKGFNVEKSYEWSKTWLSKIKETASGSLSIWWSQLAKAGLL